MSKNDLDQMGQAYLIFNNPTILMGHQWFDMKEKWHDTKLWQQFQQGDAEAFGILVRQYSDALYDYGTRFTPDGELVKDCLQDVFCVLWNRREHLSEVASIKFYLMKALRQKIIRELPKWRDVMSLDQLHADMPVFAIELEEDHTLPLAARKKLAAIVKSLSPRQKELIYLRFYKNLKQDKIAGIMGLSRQSVYNLQRSALLSLRKLVDFESVDAWVGASLFLFTIFFSFS